MGDRTFGEYLVIPCLAVLLLTLCYCVKFVLLIRKHYKEYLVYKINQSHLDPLPLCHELGPLRAMLIRDEIKVPDQQAGETEEQYCERLRQV